MFKARKKLYDLFVLLTNKLLIIGMQRDYGEACKSWGEIREIVKQSHN